MNAVPTGLRKATRFVPEVESLRGIAILLVFFHHADGLLTRRLAAGGVVVSPLRAFVAGGQSGVSLFFVLSAFCLSIPFFSARGEASRFSLLTFYERRALRILPLYWTVAFFAVVAYASTPADLGRFVPYAFFLQSLPDVVTPLPPYSNVWWSLATEVQFYLLLPLLPLVLRSPRRRWIAVAAGALYAVWFGFYVNRAFPLHSLTAEVALATSVAARGPVFLVGIAVAWIHAKHGDAWTRWMAANTLLRAGGADTLLFGVLAGLGYLLQWQVGVGYWHAEGGTRYVWHVPEGLLWGSVLLLLLVAPLRTKRLFCNRPLSYAGLWSYSIYLLHLPLLTLPMFALLSAAPDGSLNGWTPRSAAVVFALSVCCFALSACTYRWIESPFLKRKARLAG